MTTSNAPGLYLESGEFIPAAELTNSLGAELRACSSCGKEPLFEAAFRLVADSLGCEPGLGRMQDSIAALRRRIEELEAVGAGGVQQVFDRADSAYAPLPEPDITMVWSGWTEAWEPADLKTCLAKDESSRAVGYTADQMLAFADATHALRENRSPKATPLSGKKIDVLAARHSSELGGRPYFAAFDYARAIERAHGIGVPRQGINQTGEDNG